MALWNDAKVELGAAQRHLRAAVDHAEEKQREADNAWNLVEGARRRCAKAQRAVAMKRFEDGIYGPKGKRRFKRVKK